MDDLVHAPRRDQSARWRPDAALYGSPDEPARPARWLRPGACASIGDHHIRGGMIYLGRRLPAARGGRLEPALVDPGLELAGWSPEAAGTDLGYWPSYDRIPPASRTAYLHWLASGRRTPSVPIGFVFLFFYGLERRLLHDILAEPDLRPEVPLLAAEVGDLLSVYGAHASFRRYATEFANLLELVDAPPETEPDALAVPDLREPRWPAPMTLRRALGGFAAERRPLPAPWALAWAWYHPDISLRTPAFRCPEEFGRLFSLRYADKHGDGLPLQPEGRELRVDYEPASAGLRRTTFARQDIPDVFWSAEPVAQLASLVGGVCEDLGGYSRWLRRHADQRETIAGAALLPAELVADAYGRAHHPDVADLQAWLERRLDDAELAVLDAGELIERWPTASGGAMSRWEAAGLSRLLGHVGIGLEPDVRLGGSPPTAGQSVVIFRAGSARVQVPSATHAAAVTFVQLARAVAGGADGDVLDDRGGADDGQHRHLLDLACTTFHLDEHQRTRLGAHLRWLATTVASGLGSARRRLDVLPASVRTTLGDLLITVATRDGTVLPRQVASLISGYRRLGLDPETVPNLLHASLIAPPPAHTRPAATHPAATHPAPTPSTPIPPAPIPSAPIRSTPTRRASPRPAPAGGPVTVRAVSGAAAHDYTLPPPPVRQAEPAKAESIEIEPRFAPLDAATIDAKLAETAAVSSLLHGIFADSTEPAADEAGTDQAGTDQAGTDQAGTDQAGTDQAGTNPPANPSMPGSAPGPQSPPIDLVAGLDAPHSAMLRALAERESWERDDVEALAARFGLLPAGALDVLNDAALDIADDLLATGDDDIEIDTDVLRELFA